MNTLKNRSNNIFLWFPNCQSCASPISVWSSHHLGSLTLWWRGQIGPGELLFHPITQPLLKPEGQRRRARRRIERQERGSTEREGATTKAPIWFSVTGEGERSDKKKTCLFQDVLPISCARIRHGNVETDGACSGHLCVSFSAWLHVRGNYEPGGVLSIPRGCLITCLSAIHEIYCICSWL